MTAKDWMLAASAWISANLQNHIPIFETTGLAVKVRPFGGAGVLCRTGMFDAELAVITDAVRSGHSAGTEGMLYCLYVLDQGNPVPVYVGIAGATGRSGRLSVLFSNSRKKPRFDDYDGHHIGDLSTQVVPGYAKPKACKKTWADRLFTKAPSANPHLRTPVYFWGKAWSVADASVVPCFGHTLLALEEHLLIHAFRTALPGQLLNA